jgi:hypothetical protein
MSTERPDAAYLHGTVLGAVSVSRVDPDLSAIGARRTPEVLQQALVAPDDEVQPAHVDDIVASLTALR